MTECEATGCRARATQILQAEWSSGDYLLVYICEAHLDWGIRGLSTYRIERKRPHTLNRTFIEPLPE